ncbi:MAG TPA: hypothetical protein VFH31_03290 [Pyrinomonadaceae bacterium]|nr:hypothetical protein [Pyrinomonadaceae bacterium]
MDAINKAISEVRFRIPRPILDAVFTQRDQRWRLDPTSFEERILNEVVRPRVLVDCNIVGGTEALIPLEGIPFTRTNDYTTVYRIPKSMTQGRSIISALNVTFADPTRASSFGIASGRDNSAILRLGNAMLDASAPMPLTSTARVQLIGENVIMVRDTTILPANIYLRCVLANDENLSHIQIRSYRHFATLVVLAVKAYIYNEYIIQMDMAELHGGQALGRFKEVIDGYADANELYDTYLTEKWQKVAFMNDSESYSRFLRTIVGGNR